VPEAAIVEAMRFLWERMKLVVEPSGAVALAALLHHEELRALRTRRHHHQRRQRRPRRGRRAHPPGVTPTRSSVHRRPSDSVPISSPIPTFADLLERAMQSDILEPTAMALGTADARGRPSVRMVLLKGFDERGFSFYTNLESRKAAELAENPVAALCFHWQPMEVQVRIEGRVEPVSDAEADEYFASRPRGSQVGAWASKQSQPLANREELETRIRETEDRFAGADIPRPPFWSGFRVIPDRIEFWYGKASRLHEKQVTSDSPN
jgi:pyridoxamine 5'-phosphate oxidase